MKDKQPFLFGKQNYMLMIIGLVLIFIGFALMSVNNSDPNTFNPEVYGFRSITLAPILIITGFVIEFIAIFKK